MEEQEKKNVRRAFIVLGAMLLITILYASAHKYYMYLNVYIWFGVAYGMMLQYGRFCFASASRDLFAAGVPRMAVGILVALIFFSFIQHEYLSPGSIRILYHYRRNHFRCGNGSGWWMCFGFPL